MGYEVMNKYLEHQGWSEKVSTEANMAWQARAGWSSFDSEEKD